MERLRNSESRWEHPQHLGTLRFASVHFKEHVDLLWAQSLKAWSVHDVVSKVIGPRLTHKRLKLETFDRARASDVYFFVRWLSFSFNNPLISIPAQNVFESEEIGRFALCHNCVNASPLQWLGFALMSTKILGQLEFVSTVVFHLTTYIIELLS